MELIENTQTNGYTDLLLEIKEFYNHIVDETIELMDLYGCKTPLEIYCLFNFLNSFYVKDDEIFNLLYMKDKPVYSKELENDEIKGVQVLLNGGVCRHRSAMLNEIYKRMGTDSVVIVGRLETLLNFHYGNSINKQMADRVYVESMLRKISEGARIEEFKNHLKKRKISYHMQDVHDDYFDNHKKMPNHVIVMVGDDKRYYLDPMNNVTYYKDDRDVATLRNRSGLYFFSPPQINKFFWGCWSGKNQELAELYDRILQLPGAIESETIQNIKEIYSYLKQFQKGIEEFAKSKSDSIEETRKKCLSLPKK